MKMWISDVLNKLEALPKVACICPEKSPLKLYNAEAFGWAQPLKFTVVFTTPAITVM